MVLGALKSIFGHVMKVIWGNKTKIMKHLVVDYYLNWLKQATPIPNFIINGLSRYFDFSIDAYHYPERHQSGPGLLDRAYNTVMGQPQKKKQTGFFDRAYNTVMGQPQKKKQPGLFDRAYNLIKSQPPPKQKGYFERFTNYFTGQQQKPKSSGWFGWG